MRRRSASEKYRGVCECGDHAWCELTKGFVAMVSPVDGHLLANRAHQALSVNGRVYAMVTIERRPEYLHRLLVSAPPELTVDHINHNTLDNRRDNLRLCTIGENCKNSSQHRRSPWPYKGIRCRYGRWHAHIGEAGKTRHLGTFDTPEEAARAYDVAALKLFGAFASVNFPELSDAR